MIIAPIDILINIRDDNICKDDANLHVNSVNIICETAAANNVNLRPSRSANGNDNRAPTAIPIDDIATTDRFAVNVSLESLLDDDDE